MFDFQIVFDFVTAILSAWQPDGPIGVILVALLSALGL